MHDAGPYNCPLIYMYIPKIFSLMKAIQQLNFFAIDRPICVDSRNMFRLNFYSFHLEVGTLH